MLSFSVINQFIPTKSITYLNTNQFHAFIYLEETFLAMPYPICFFRLWCKVLYTQLNNNNKGFFFSFILASFIRLCLRTILWATKWNKNCVMVNLVLCDIYFRIAKYRQNAEKSLEQSDFKWFFFWCSVSNFLVNVNLSSFK